MQVGAPGPMPSPQSTQQAGAAKQGESSGGAGISMMKKALDLNASITTQIVNSANPTRLLDIKA